MRPAAQDKGTHMRQSMGQSVGESMGQAGAGQV